MERGASQTPYRFAVENGRSVEAMTRVLVVEDEVLIRIAAVAALETDGFEVAEADDGPSAVALIESGEVFDALFTDVNMPGSPDGYGLADIACRRLPNLRVLITSGRPAPPEPYPCDGRFLPKPYEPEDLGGRLRQLGVTPN